MSDKSQSTRDGNVFATDTILSTLMTAPRSLYSWDIVVERVKDKLFLDKRDDSEIGMHKSCRSIFLSDVSFVFFSIDLFLAVLAYRAASFILTSRSAERERDCQRAAAGRNGPLQLAVKSGARGHPHQRELYPAVPQARRRPPG